MSEYKKELQKTLSEMIKEDETQKEVKYILIMFTGLDKQKISA